MSPVQCRVGLFVSCLVDVMRPVVGFSCISLLERAGCEVVVPLEQTCCGQPALNSGDRQSVCTLAPKIFSAFLDVDAIVTPSASCAATLKFQLAMVVKDNHPELSERAEAFSAKVFELTEFLAHQGYESVIQSSFDGRVAYHEACSAKRDLGLTTEPRNLLKRVKGCELVELADKDTCCGFGGLFSVKFPDISNAMVDKKCQAIAAARADLVVSTELGCLLNIAGKLSHSGLGIPCRHIAEVLAGDLSAPPLAMAGPDASARAGPGPIA
jgi:L-lactate dehydrogenase complex protein LldE